MGHRRRSSMTTAMMTMMRTTVPRPMYTGFSFSRVSDAHWRRLERVPRPGLFSRERPSQCLRAVSGRRCSARCLRLEGPGAVRQCGAARAGTCALRSSGSRWGSVRQPGHDQGAKVRGAPGQAACLWSMNDDGGYRGWPVAVSAPQGAYRRGAPRTARGGSSPWTRLPPRARQSMAGTSCTALRAMSNERRTSGCSALWGCEAVACAFAERPCSSSWLF